MNDTFEPEDGLTARLRALGQFPVDPATQARHLTAMAEAAAAPTLFGTLGNRIRIAVALVVGFMLGTTGLASAGALGPLQPIASTTLEKVGVDVPNGKATGKTIYTEGCRSDVGEYRNHGQYIKAVRASGADATAVQAAAESDCGKPAKAVANKAKAGGDDEVEGTETEATETEETGKPDDAGKPANPGKSGEKGKSAEKSQKPEDGDTPGADEAECAGGVAAPSTTPPAQAPKQPGCAEDEKSSHAPNSGTVDTEGVELEDDTEDAPSSVADDNTEDHTQDKPAPEQVPSEADTSSDGS